MHSDFYFSALNVNLLTDFTKEATQTIHHFVQKCSRCIENYCFKYKNLVGCVGLCPLTPAWVSAPDPHYRLVLLGPCLLYIVFETSDIELYSISILVYLNVVFGCCRKKLKFDTQQWLVLVSTVHWIIL